MDVQGYLILDKITLDSQIRYYLDYYNKIMAHGL